ncbi:uncharacterized protein [Dysidea avara]|uniref:uncharacterized protein n=1 Tax=Dysidea avara TaxID=196820 RepID=UPI00332D8AE0
MSMDSTISPWKFGAIVGGVVALLILVILLVVAIALLRRYLHNKQNSRYSQHVEDGNSNSLSRLSFGVLWSLYKPDKKDNSPPVTDDVAGDDVQPPATQPLSSHVFAADQQPIKTPSQDQPLRSTSQYVITPMSRPSGDNLVGLDLPGSPQHSEAGSEAFYHTLEGPVVTAALQSLQLPTSGHEQSGITTKERLHSSHSYSSISSDIQPIPPPPVTTPAHRRGRRYSLPNTLMSVTHNSQHSAGSTTPIYINYRGGRRNSDPAVTMLPSPLATTPGIRSPAEYEKPMAHASHSYTQLDLSGVVHHAYTPLNISGDPTTPPEHLFQRQPLQMSTRSRVIIGHLRMNSIPEENNNYERLQPTPKPKY